MSFLDSVDTLGRLNYLDQASSGGFDPASPFNFALATVADVGTSLWNSITFGQAEVSTTALLGALGADGAIKAYNNNREAVELLSLVGGALIPGFGALKLTKAIRDGNKAFYAFSSQRKAEDVQKMQWLISEGKKATTDYRKLRNSSIIRAQASNMADVVASEIAVLGALNAHPLMEDYFEDPVKNFGISMALGGAISAPITAIGTRATLRGAEAVIDKGARAAIMESAALYEMPFADTASRLLSMEQAAANISAMADLPTTNVYTKQLANDIAQIIRGNAGKLADSKIVEGLEPEARRHLQRLMTTPEFLGVDSTKYYSPSSTSLLAKAKAAVLPRSSRTEFTTLGKDSDGNPITELVVDHFFSPEHGSFIPKEWADQVASAADTYSQQGILELATKMRAKELSKAVSPELMPTHRLEAEYLARTSFYNGLPTDKLSDVRIIGNDLPALNGWVNAVETRKKFLSEELSKLDMTAPDAANRMSDFLAELDDLTKAKITISDGELVRAVKIEELAALPTVGSGASLARAVRSSHFSEMRDLFHPDGGKRSINGAEVDTLPSLVSWKDAGGATHGDIADLVNDLKLKVGGFNGSQKNFYDAVRTELSNPAALAELNQAFPVGASADSLSPMAKAALLIMIAGDEPGKIAMRQGLESARTLRQGVDSSILWHKEWDEILKHPLSVKQREALAKHVASEDGSIYLYRGLSNAPTGQTSMASYSWDKGVADSFSSDPSNITVNRVKVKDIVGYLYAGESEFLVASSTRENLAGEISDFVGSQTSKKKKPAFNMPKTTELDYDGAKDFLKTQTLDSLAKSVRDGMPVEVAAIRHNMSTDQAMSVLSVDPKELPARWTSVDQIQDALSHERRIVHATAKKRHHLGEEGEIQEKLRLSIEEGAEMSTEFRRALNQGDSLAHEEIKAKLNVMDSLYGQIHQEWIGLTMATSRSHLAKSLYQGVMDSTEYNLLRQFISEASNAVGGNSMFQSADFVTRNMEKISRIVTSRGDKRVQAVNETTKRLLEPVSKGFRSLADDPVSRTEFAMLDKFRQQTKGPLFWDPQEGRFYLGLPEAGKPIDSHVGPATTNPKVLGLMDNLVAASDELRELRRTHSRLANGVAPQDIGVWIPSQKVLGKEYSYISNIETGEIKLLVGETLEDLEALKGTYKLQPNEKLIPRSNYEMEQIALLEDGRIEKVTMANVDSTKQGITRVEEDLSSLRLEDIMTGYTAQLNRLATGIMEEAMHDVMVKLDAMSAINQRAWTDTGKTGWRKAKAQLEQRDVAGDVKDYLLGKNPAHRNEYLRNINGWMDTTISWAASQAQAAWQMVKPSRLGSELDYQKYNSALKAAGINNPFEVFEESARSGIYAMAANAGYQKDPQRIVNAFNALASTTALKFMEIAQPLVNILSLPILMSSTISRMTDISKMNAGTFFENSQMAIMSSGLRRAMSNHPTNKRYFDMGIKEGLLTATISEADDALRLARLQTDKGALSKLERAVESDFVNLMSKPATWADEMVRRVAFGTAVDLALRNYGPTVSDRQVLIFARDFMKQAIGNYSSHQRPAMFQGSFGSAMGLFQTYMVTYAQNTYSHLEKGDFKGLAKMMLAQGGIFGTYSLPGWNPISQVIGENFSDEHFDLTTGLYRAMPDKLASTIVYGLPSNLLGALHTRGDVSPRLPTGFSEFVAPSMVGQLAETVIEVAKGAARFDATAGNAMLEALSVQSASRPIARLAELANGYSTTKAGIMVAGEEEVWSFQGVLSRVLSTRTLAEAKAREVIHLNTVYGQEDRANRQSLIKALRQDIRASNLSNDKLDRYAQEYLRTGSPQGWRASVNEAFLANENKGILDLSKKLDGSPLSLILDDLDL